MHGARPAAQERGDEKKSLAKGKKKRPSRVFLKML